MPDVTMHTQMQNSLAAGRKPPQIPHNADLAKIRETAQDFEAFYLGQMLQPMFANLGAEEPFGGGSAENTWRTLLVDEYGKAIARKGGVGIADAVVQQMLRMQEIE